MKKLFVKTYGCQMNAYDSARIADLLAPLGYGAAAAPEDADMVVLNTCHIREKAAEKVYSELGTLRALKEEKAGRGDAMLIAVAGCVAQAEGELMLQRAPVIDLLVGPQTYHRLPEMIAKVARAGGKALQTDFPALEKYISSSSASRLGIPRAARRMGSSFWAESSTGRFLAHAARPRSPTAPSGSPSSPSSRVTTRRRASSLRAAMPACSGMRSPRRIISIRCSTPLAFHARAWSSRSAPAIRMRMPYSARNWPSRSRASAGSW
jgi:hypothetical protein